MDSWDNISNKNISSNSSDDHFSDEDDEAFPEKSKWSQKEFNEAVLSGQITPFYSPFPEKTPLNGSFCNLCYSFFPRLNKCECCNKGICSKCFITLFSHDYSRQKCCFCTKPIKSIIPNRIELEEINDDNKQYPNDIYEIAAEFGLGKFAVDELLNSGEKINDFEYKFFFAYQ